MEAMVILWSESENSDVRVPTRQVIITNQSTHRELVALLTLIHTHTGWEMARGNAGEEGIFFTLIQYLVASVTEYITARQSAGETIRLGLDGCSIGLASGRNLR